jgi:hypothetical protein
MIHSKSQTRKIKNFHYTMAKIIPKYEIRCFKALAFTHFIWQIQKFAAMHVQSISFFCMSPNLARKLVDYPIGLESVRICMGAHHL